MDIRSAMPEIYEPANSMERAEVLLKDSLGLARLMSQNQCNEEFF